MRVLKFVRTFFLVITLGLLFLVALESGEYNQDKIDARIERATTGYQVADPEDPWPVQKFFLLWAYRLGGGWATFQSIILVLKLRKEKKFQRTQTNNDRIMIITHHN